MTFHFARHVLPAAFSIGVLALTMSAVRIAAAQDKAEPKDEKPSLSLRASPNVGFSPARVVLTVDVKGGPNDYEEFYCAGVEWEWGDGTTSEAVTDCEPYEPGKSEIKRRYSTSHIFDTAGNFRVNFKLKRKDKVLAVANTQVTIRPGLTDPGSY